MPSEDVVTICKTAEKVLRSTPNLFLTNILDKLITHAKMLLILVKLFSKLDMFMEKEILSNYKLDLINVILKTKYFF